ncbi:MAG: hypothetical protein ACXWCM_06185 [Acidimicrobiales bacterium]
MHEGRGLGQIWVGGVTDQELPQQGPTALLLCVPSGSQDWISLEAPLRISRDEQDVEDLKRTSTVEAPDLPVELWWDAGNAIESHDNELDRPHDGHPGPRLHTR